MREELTPTDISTAELAQCRGLLLKGTEHTFSMHEAFHGCVPGRHSGSSSWAP